MHSRDHLDVQAEGTMCEFVACILTVLLDYHGKARRRLSDRHLRGAFVVFYMKQPERQGDSDMHICLCQYIALSRGEGASGVKCRQPSYGRNAVHTLEIGIDTESIQWYAT